MTRNLDLIMSYRRLRGDKIIADILGVTATAISKRRRQILKWSLEDLEAIGNAWGINPGLIMGDAPTLIAALTNPPAATGTDDTTPQPSPAPTPRRSQTR